MNAMRVLPYFLLITVCALAGPSRLLAQEGTEPHTYYVDFDSGSDSAIGTSQNAAWKHAPGDDKASGVPAKVILVPGDTVLFHADVIYRGSIQVKNSGAPGKPITYSGEGWGNGHAIMTGRDSFDMTPSSCTSSPVCSNLPNADRLILINLPVQVTRTSQIALDGHILQLSQLPKPAGPFRFDDIESYAKTLTPNVSQLPDGNTWQIKSDFIQKTLAGDGIDDLLALVWGYPGVVVSGPATSYDQASGALQVSLSGFKLNPHKDVQFALANHPRLITQPYEYATVEHGTKIVASAPLNSAKLEIATRLNAFHALGQQNFVIKGFEIEGYVGGPRDWRGGIALVAENTTGAVFSGNSIHDLESWAGAGAVAAGSVAGLTVSSNHFWSLPNGSGVRVDKGKDVHIFKNDFDNIGRTGIMFMNVEGGLIDHNRLTHVYGSHGNGISIYLSNRDVVVKNNEVSDSTRAITFEGNGHPEIRNNIIFRANLLRADGVDGVALQSWGGATNGVTIERNVILVDGAVDALRLSGRDSNILVKQNVIDGYQGYPLPLSPDTLIQGNIFVSDSRGSTEGNDVEPGDRKRADMLFSGKDSPEICKFLLANAEAGSGIGPDDVCRAP